ncbi:uncharacterized protein LOC143022278 [Oratosquilla oratoria]|uniref:uncharacterized protein LOC143022278 n=1 Tax=Oratosquilla oratoria TaxID=337810 RepID=UPI003F75EDB2
MGSPRGRLEHSSSQDDRLPFSSEELRKLRLDIVALSKLTCPPRDTLIILDDFNVVADPDRAGYEVCIGPHGSGIRNINISLLLNFAKSRRLRIASSWLQRREPHRWAWYSNAGGVAQEIDHIFVSTHWKILQKCRVYRSAELFGIDHRLVVATLRLRIKSRRIPRCNLPEFHLEKLRDDVCAQEYAVPISNWFEVHDSLEEPEELGDIFKHGTLNAAEHCVEERPRPRSGVASWETLKSIKLGRAVTMAGDLDEHRTQEWQTRALMRIDKERYIRGIVENAEGHFNANGHRPAYRVLEKFCSKSVPQRSTIRTADVELVSGVENCSPFAKYFKQLLMGDPPNGQFSLDGAQVAVPDPPIDKSPPSLTEIKEAGKEDWHDCNKYRGIILFNVPGKVFVHLLLTRVRSHLLKFQRSEKPGFTPESLEVLVAKLESLHREVRPLGIEVS